MLGWGVYYRPLNSEKRKNGFPIVRVLPAAESTIQVLPKEIGNLRNILKCRKSVLRFWETFHFRENPATYTTSLLESSFPHFPVEIHLKNQRFLLSIIRQ